MIYFILRSCRIVFQGCLIALWSVLILLGGVAVIDVWNKPDLPQIRPAPQPRQDCAGIKTPQQIVALDDVGRWQALQPALQILDEVCPEVAAFVRHQWGSGRLVFGTANRGYYAAWYVIPRILVVNCIAWEFGDVELACTLAHEFRHSRQPLLPALQVGVAAACGVNRLDLVEREACEWEGRIRSAIRGKH